MLKAQADASSLVFTIQILFANIVVSCFSYFCMYIESYIQFDLID